LRFGLDGGQTVTAFVLTAGRRPPARHVEAMRVADGGCAFRLHFDGRTDCLLASDNEQAAWTAFDLSFCGSVAWWSSEQEVSGRLSWADGRSFQTRRHRVRAQAPGGAAVLSGRLDDRGFEGEMGEVVCESWKEDQWSPSR
jgi:hypothetical protein